MPLLAHGGFAKVLLNEPHPFPDPPDTSPVPGVDTEAVRVAKRRAAIVGPARRSRGTRRVEGL